MTLTSVGFTMFLVALTRKEIEMNQLSIQKHIKPRRDWMLIVLGILGVVLAFMFGAVLFQTVNSIKDYIYPEDKRKLIFVVSVLSFGVALIAFRSLEFCYHGWTGKWFDLFDSLFPKKY